MPDGNLQNTGLFPCAMHGLTCEVTSPVEGVVDELVELVSSSMISSSSTAETTTQTDSATAAVSNYNFLITCQNVLINNPH